MSTGYLDNNPEHSGNRYSPHGGNVHHLGEVIAIAERVHKRHSKRMSLVLLGASLLIAANCLIIMNH